jgi:hypothetical protein
MCNPSKQSNIKTGVLAVSTIDRRKNQRRGRSSYSSTRNCVTLPKVVQNWASRMPRNCCAAPQNCAFMLNSDWYLTISKISKSRMPSRSPRNYPKKLLSKGRRKDGAVDFRTCLLCCGLPRTDP